MQLEMFFSKISEKEWQCYCPQLKIKTVSGTPRQAFVGMGNALKRVTNEQLKKVL